MKRLLIILSIGLLALMPPAQAQKPHSDLRNEIGVDAGPISMAGGLIFGTVGFFNALGSGLSHKAMDSHLYGEYGIHYYYQVTHWCQVGFKTTVEGAQVTRYTDSLRTSVESISRDLLFSVMPSVRFTYLNRPWVRLYSGVDLGVGYFLSTRQDMAKEKDSNNFLFAFNITPLGVNVGKQFYGLFELNAGFDSIVKVGIGARF